MERDTILSNSVYQWVRNLVNAYSDVVLGLEAVGFVCPVDWVEPLKLREVEAKMERWIPSNCLSQSI